MYYGKIPQYNDVINFMWPILYIWADVLSVSVGTCDSSTNNKEERKN